MKDMEENIITSIIRKFMSALIGLIVGILFGMILSLIATKVFILLYHFRFDQHSSPHIYTSSGMIYSIAYSIIGTTFFSPVFGRLNLNPVRILIGLFLGIAAGAHLGYSFLYVPAVEQFGKQQFIIYTAFWGGLGGFFVALFIKPILNATIYRSDSIKVDLNSTNAGIWSAIIGGIFALSVSLISLNKGLFSKEQEKLYIVVYSTKDKKEAIDYANTKINSDYSPEIFFASNGSYAVTIGYYPPAKAKHIKDMAIQNGLIDNTSYLIGSKGIIKRIYPESFSSSSSDQ
jgi:hypothetical protein